MDLLFLHNRTLEVLDFAHVENEFQIIIDNVVPQASTFTINKEKINASVGDYLTIKGNEISYIGIITALELDEEKHVLEIRTNDFISILDIEVPLKSYNGQVIYYLYSLIRKAYVVNDDAHQNLPYMTLEYDRTVTTSAEITYDDDTIGSISSVLETFNKAYSISAHYDLIYTNGKITGIHLLLRASSTGVVLKSSVSCISNMVVTDNSSQAINKITYVPQACNTSYKNTISYYLQTDGIVTMNPVESKRCKFVSGVTRTYSDSERSSLFTMAQSEILSSSLEHSITFDYVMNNKIAVLFKDMTVDDFIVFITPNKTYETMITKVIFDGSLKTCQITLGEYRGTLTEKLKLLAKK